VCVSERESTQKEERVASGGSGVDFLKVDQESEAQSPRYTLRTQYITIHKLLRRLHTVGISTRDEQLSH
jgi:hypothetical protein